MKKLRVIILAAGKGTRMKSQIPKVLHKVCGRPIIDYVLDVVDSVKSEKFYTVLGHKIEEVKSYLPKNIVVVEQKQLLGTADAVKSCERSLKNFNGHILIVCGDTPLLNKDVIKRLLNKHVKLNAACTVLTAVVDDPTGYGRILRDEQNCAVAIREEKDAVDHEKKVAEINVGVYAFSCSELFKALKEVKQNPKKKEFYLTDTIEWLVSKGYKVETQITDNAQEGLGVNSREDLAVAESVIRKKILKRFMQDGVTIVDPANTYIAANAKIGTDTTIRPFTFIEDNVSIGERCVIGPFARLRPGTVIDSDVEIGNFTEISRSKISSNSIMKHFGFLGDAQIGKNVNIGAGTVTANYDGKNKNVTKILDGAFIGSDAILVAPVEIGRKAIVGAGSVVVRGKVPDQSLAVGVPAVVKRKVS